MLTGNLVRARMYKGTVRPEWLDPQGADWLAAAEQLIEVHRSSIGRMADEVEDAGEEIISGVARPMIARGLAKLLEDRCDFETPADIDPIEVRRTVFEESARVGWRQAEPAETYAAERRRELSLSAAAARMGRSVADLESALYADLRGARRLVKFDEPTPERLLQRYNVALAQGVLLKARGMTARIGPDTPARCRRLFSQIKFHRLLYQASGDPASGYEITLDGPLSLLRRTQKYGLQLAMFLPSLMLCKQWSLEADVAWGEPPRDAKFALSSDKGLASTASDIGTYVPDEIRAFAKAFAEKNSDWTIHEDAQVIPLGREGVLVPDLRFEHAATGKTVFFEVLGFWNRGSLMRRLELQRVAGLTEVITAVSTELDTDEADLESLPATVYRFRSMPIVREVAALLARFV